MSSGTRGFSRDRTAAFLRHRGASTSAGGGGGGGGRGRGGSLGLGGEADSASLLGNDGANGASVAQIAANVPPAWVDVQEEVARYMEQIRLKMSQLSKAHKKAALPTFDDMDSKDNDVEVLTGAARDGSGLDVAHGGRQSASASSAGSEPPPSDHSPDVARPRAVCTVAHSRAARTKPGDTAACMIR